MSRPMLALVKNTDDTWNDLITRCHWEIVKALLKGDLRDGVIRVADMVLQWNQH